MRGISAAAWVGAGGPPGVLGMCAADRSPSDVQGEPLSCHCAGNSEILSPEKSGLTLLWRVYEILLVEEYRV